ncbi:ADP-ribosylglycohydrolase family protein [Desnuesiella massiliensis]|uniref:ADP-ribosylglycohydrolase family protein n=1 Tax=Desnuesiella massiliensis TaxID=1650662 RepID=UPI0006E1A313|nr:ADP-ribosylglycohydrolase family protein [Desnuesiella massiliensis]
MIQRDYIERVYSGWLGKAIGVRLGAPIENWTYERIKEEIGEPEGYIHDYKMFAADDDTNGPMVFIRALEDYSIDAAAHEIGDTWLNYIGDTHGMFWWGGYGVSTEHTAYMNLQHGIKAPLSGSIEVNGLTVSEQIGGQIFIDVWGLIAPGNPSLAAQYAEKAASVSHDGNGKYGGMFIAACISEAFVEKDIRKIINKGLSVIPENCEYAKVTREIMRFYDENPSDWRKCFQYIYDNFGYDKYEGGCHIIPNAAVIILSLLYGEGDFSETIRICNFCGWDTDCNVGNVGCIMGVRGGIEGIPHFWRKPINDVFVSSSLIGDLNIADIPLLSAYLARFGYILAKEEIPYEIKSLDETGEIYNFSLPGSTHGFKALKENVILENVNDCLKVCISNESSVKIFRKTYYRPSDFEDDRYSPDFSPIIYPGYTISAEVKAEGDCRIAARLYVKDGNSNTYIYGDKTEVSKKEWSNLVFSIPKLKAACLDEMGVELYSDALINYNVYINKVEFKASPNYVLDFSKECVHKWSPIRKTPSQLTYLRGIWDLEQGYLSGSGFGNSESYTGSRKWIDYEAECELIPVWGKKHNLNFRVWGAMRSYAAGLGEENKLILYKNVNGNYIELASISFKWQYEQAYKLRITAHKNKFTVYVDEKRMIDYTDTCNPYFKGQVGFSTLSGSHTHYKYLKVKTISEE